MESRRGRSTSVKGLTSRIRSVGIRLVKMALHIRLLYEDAHGSPQIATRLCELKRIWLARCRKSVFLRITRWWNMAPYVSRAETSKCGCLRAPKCIRTGEESACTGATASATTFFSPLMRKKASQGPKRERKHRIESHLPARLS